MMGKIEIVKAFIADDPGVVNLKGPHGIPLIKHAERGGQDARLFAPADERGF